MADIINNESFDDLRHFAYRLDLQFGVGVRKRILEGNEKISLGTKSQVWNDWLNNVQQRLRHFYRLQLPKELDEQLARLFELTSAMSLKENQP